MVTVYTYFYKQKSRLLMEAAGPLFYSFSDFELVLILITAGAWSDETSEKIGKLRANGMSVPEIAEELGVKANTVWSYLPYSKGMYNQEYPTINAIRVRNSKRKAKEKALTCTDTAQNEGSGAC